MPFDEDDDDLPAPAPVNVGLKKVSTQKSMFEDLPKKPTQEGFEKKVKNNLERNNSYKQKINELSILFKKSIADTTLPENKNIFSGEMESELLSRMIQLASEINNDRNEQEGIGSLSWIALLFKTLFYQRDKINKLSYSVVVLEKKLETLSGNISTEINRALDKKKTSE